MMLNVWRWTRRTASVALLVVLTIMWQVASAFPGGAPARLFVVAASLYVAGALLATWLTSRWIKRHRAAVIVTAMVAGRYPAGRGLLTRRRLHTWPRLWSYRTEGVIQHYAFVMPVGMTLTQLERWREPMEQALDRAVDWRYEGGLFHMRVIAGRMPARVSFGELYG